jgi:glycerate 2-kinase
MKIVVAPNAFKGSLSAAAAADAIRSGVLAAHPEGEVISVPVADGGDGFAEVMAGPLGATHHTLLVAGPRLVPVQAHYCFVAETTTAVIEMASASGLALLAHAERDPTLTSTYGTGELIRAALDHGASRIIIGLGGSATCDGGIGMAAALGYRFLDRNGSELPPVGSSLPDIEQIDPSGRDPRLARVTCIGVCDVTNPLYGEQGASYVYSPQKGASMAQVTMLDGGLRNLATVFRHDLGVSAETLPGSGAAGGLGAGLVCFLGASLNKGIDVVMDLVDLRTKINDAALVITGEGQIDFQTQYDKAPAGVARLAKEAGVPCIAICGSVGERVHELYAVGITGVFSICSRPLTLEQAMNDGAALLAASAEQVVRTFLAGRSPASS